METKIGQFCTYVDRNGGTEISIHHYLFNIKLKQLNQSMFNHRISDCWLTGSR